MRKILTILILLIFMITSVPIADANPRGYSGRRTTHVRGYRRNVKWVNSHSSHTYSNRPKKSTGSRKRYR